MVSLADNSSTFEPHNVNSRQRRKRLHNLETSGNKTSFNQPPSKSKKAKSTSRLRLARFVTIGKIVWALVVGAATLLSYNVLKPSISIEPYASQDPLGPFTEQFYLQNNSIYDIHQVVPRCGIENVRSTNFTMSDFSILNPLDMAGTLAAGSKMTATCPLDQLFKGPPQSYSQLYITIWATYTLPLGIPACQATNFNGKPATNGKYIWTYNGSVSCKDLDKPHQN